MQETKSITIISNRKKIVLAVGTILYVLMIRRKAEIHVAGGKIYETGMTLSELEEMLGDGFIKVHRGCLVSIMAVHAVTDSIDLNNGEVLEYSKRKKNEIIEQLRRKQQQFTHAFSTDGIPTTEEEYRRHYSAFEQMPFAFADIEIVFDEERRAVDWIFRYGNPALAKLEKTPIERLIGRSFGSVFENMDSKWLRGYERAAFYGEMLELVDYSPEINTYLKVICFPTFRGHCGCILFDVSEIKFAKTSSDTEKALMLYFGKLMSKRAGQENGPCEKDGPVSDSL